MNRETMIAVVFGILLGAGVGLFVLFQTTRGEEAKVIPVTGDNDQKKLVQAEEQVATGSSPLVISAPENNLVTSTDSITIQGKVRQNSLIIIQTPSTEEVFKNEAEDFSVEIPLAGGENVIQVSAYSESSTPQEHSMRVYYLKE